MPAQKRAKSNEPTPTLYDGSVRQRIAIEVEEGSEVFQTAHLIGPMTEARFIEFLDSADLSSDDMDVMLAELNDATRELWRGLKPELENIEVPANEDIRDLIPFEEIEQVMSAFLNVRVVPHKSDGIRRLSAAAPVTIETVALLNGRPLKQTHKLKRKTDELRKKYEHIYRTGENAPTQSERALAKGKLYDEMKVEVTGFKGAIPLRFKTIVIDHHFRPAIDAKK